MTPQLDPASTPRHDPGLRKGAGTFIAVKGQASDCDGLPVEPYGGMHTAATGREAIREENHLNH